MKIGIICPDYIFPSEEEILSYFFEKGIEFAVMRKSQNLERDIVRFIDDIPQKYHDKIIIQDRFNLLKHFSLNGILLSKKKPKAPSLEKRFTKGVSCSRIDDILKYQNFQNIFFGPVFESISKNNIKPVFGETALIEAKAKNIINEKVIAMGGIDEETILKAKMIGFERVALFGGLWGNYFVDNDKEALYARFENLMKLATGD